MSVLDIELPMSFRPTSLKLMSPPTVASIGAVVRQKKPVYPKDDTELRPGDHVLVVGLTQDEDATRAFFMASPATASSGAA